MKMSFVKALKHIAVNLSHWLAADAERKKIEAQNLRLKTLLEIYESERIQIERIATASGSDHAPDTGSLVLAKSHLDRTRNVIDLLHRAEEVRSSEGNNDQGE